MATIVHVVSFNKEIFDLSWIQHTVLCHFIPEKVFEGNDISQHCLLTVLLSPAECCHFHSQWAVLNQTEGIGH